MVVLTLLANFYKMVFHLQAVDYLRLQLQMMRILLQEIFQQLIHMVDLVELRLVQINLNLGLKFMAGHFK
jgi:hypothetical protein